MNTGPIYASPILLSPILVSPILVSPILVSPGKARQPGPQSRLADPPSRPQRFERAEHIEDVIRPDAIGPVEQPAAGVGEAEAEEDGQADVARVADLSLFE